MAELAEAWKQALPEMREAVTGVGVWTALNTAKPIAVDEGVLVIGLPHEEMELSGHLKMPQIRRVIESAISQRLEQSVTLRVIEGTTDTDYETVKRRDAEARRLQEQQLNKLRAELQAKTNWDTVYEQLNRRYAAIPNKSLAQNKARFFEEAVELIVEARKSQTNHDDLSERNFARCLERVAQYSELPSTFVAARVLQQAGEL
jgi:hypothetical protein